MVPQKGQKAPDFSLPASTGRTVSLRDLAGRKVVLYIYPKDDTRGCTVEACSFRDNYASLQQAGAVVLGMSADDLESHDRFAQKHSLPFPLLFDKDAAVINRYGAWGEKTVGERRVMGIKRTTFLIDEKGNIARLWENVKPEAHGEEVLEAVRGRK